MRRYSHLTPRYITNRLRVWVNERRHPSRPWLTTEAVDRLEQILQPSHDGLEFGSGRSTTWFAERLGTLISLEHDPEWHQHVAASLRQSGLAGKVDYRLINHEDDYAAFVEDLPDDSLDFCLVDGIARDRCAVAVIQKLRPGAVLVVDNVNWYLPNDRTHSPDSRRQREGPAEGRWAEFMALTQTWRCEWTSNGVTDTALWLKPATAPDTRQASAR